MGEYIPEAERAEMEALAVEREDAPIENPFDRACMVSLELRKKGLYALQTGKAVCVYFLPQSGAARIYATDDHATKGPRAIADAIQAEEAKRAQEWAGDL
jgi:hypothetical protein